ncbi:GNAT family N-acetyltransferase [Streptacidiphilus rugosus]|uniref:GNAT family N-acetyltransferase n=1 Tax=Streptacidiphilus rugosus TaxID=405783 RepID=UPI0005625D8B|nr:GNAT family N-acetyltransferase [Streptacidiphilus rugosus]
MTGSARLAAPAARSVHRTPETLAPFEDGWRELLVTLPGASYFSTPDWILASWEDLPARRRADGEIVLWTGPQHEVEAVLPLLRARQRLHPRIPVPVDCWSLLGAGADAADHGMLPARPWRRAELSARLRERTGGRTLWLPAMDPDADTALLPPGSRRIARVTCPRLTVGPETRAGSGGLRRKERQLARAGVSFRFVPPESMDAATLDAVLLLHARRLAVKGEATAFTPARRDFHLGLQRRAAPGRGPAALLAEREGVPVGALYGFLWERTFAYYNGGWEAEFAPFSLGSVLHAIAVRTVARTGVTRYDFLRGAESYKSARFGAVDRFDEQWLLARGASARLAGAVLRAARRPSRSPCA